jgi:hypothetical protein
MLLSPIEISASFQTRALPRSADGTSETPRGLLIVNADDWGRDRETTERMLTCFDHGALSSVSAMVFMADSERSAALAHEQGIDAGLHLNFTTPFSAANRSARLIEHQRKTIACLRRNSLAQAMFHPGLAGSFQYLVRAQYEEFCHLYGTVPARIDGHHHMHLCANVLFGKLLPSGTIVRRNFSFERGEKGLANRLYRGAIDRLLARRHRLTDLFFSLAPLNPFDRVQRIVTLASRSVVELETHPINPDEFSFLMSGNFFRSGDGVNPPQMSLASHGNS